APEPNAAQQLQALSQHHAALRARLKSLARTQAEQLHALSQDLAALRTTLESCAEAQGEQQRILAALRHDCEQRFSQFAATLDAVQREAARQAALLRALAWLCSASLLACGGLSLWLALR
ncbi:MAG: hypothetical protein N2483_10470, partial [Burkholderiaceae bacterium]|nr:hypothetical protein [Burkholderiaceae bacterium]